MKLTFAEPLLSRLGRGLLSVLALTWRFRVTGEEPVAELVAARRPYILALWHSGILPLLFSHRDRGIVLLISRHRDGGHLADLAAGLGYSAVRGSTNRGGDVGLLGLIGALETGNIVALTPDGPRGPAEKVQPGIVSAARHARAPIVPIAANASAEWRLPTWDRMRIPKPFARLDVRFGAPIHVGPAKEDARRALAELERVLAALSAPA
ncbi:MAG TPA: lysophospholipid acyltransferase family protein [Gemmatimonadales bacterium]|nr:lysophospholipid acyltransferase family protein [Gemmatimonadales bacterium]